MFHRELDSKKMARHVFSEMKVVVRKMLINGYNILETPPHACGVYLVTSKKDPNVLGIGRTDPLILSEIPHDSWAIASLFELDSARDEEQYPIGAFVGFVSEHPHLYLDREQTIPLDIFAGVLISPDGSEMAGCYSPLSDLSKIVSLWDDPEKAFPELSTYFNPLQFTDTRH